MRRGLFSIFWGVTIVTSFYAVASGGELQGLTQELVDAIPYPENQEPTQAQIELGNKLFFDKSLSRNRTQSCATCHNPEKGFGDGLKISKGSQGNLLERNSPHLFNLAWNEAFFWDGRSNSLEEQALEPIQNPDEMNLDLQTLLKRLKKDPYYQKQFRKAYGTDEKSSGRDIASEEYAEITTENLARALASFQRTLVSYGSPFDRYMSGSKDALSTEQVRGKKLFAGKAKCITCHFGPHFTDHEFHNTGTVTEDKGRYNVDRIGRKEFDMVPYPFFATLRAFKTPSLRNVEHTAPYFHDGSEATLKDVLNFYNQGGKNKERAGVARGIEKLNLTKREMKDIISFLKALTSPVKVKPVK